MRPLHGRRGGGGGGGEGDLMGDMSGTSKWHIWDLQMVGHVWDH
jgi:hypothetical protein